MPLTSTSTKDIRVATLYSSGNRQSNIEHLQHMSRLTDAKSGQFPRNGGVDFSRPPPIPNSPVTTTDKLKRRTEVEEARITFENNLLLSKMADHNTQDNRLRNALSLVPAPKDESSFPRLSNLHPRTVEARRIDQANLDLGERIRNTRSTVSNDSIVKSNARHKELVSRISKFKPTLHNEPFVGATLMLKEGGVDLLADNPKRWGNSRNTSTSPRGRKYDADHNGAVMESRYRPSTSWHNPSIEDIRRLNLHTDKYYHRLNPNGTGGGGDYTVHRALGGMPQQHIQQSPRGTISPLRDRPPPARLTRHHTDHMPEALHMEFTDHKHGTGRICSKGCFHPHHLQRGEWSAVATARDAQRRIEDEQFSITNQLEIQRASRAGEEPRIQYSTDAMRMVAKAQLQTSAIGNTNAGGGITSPSVLFGHMPLAYSAISSPPPQSLTPRPPAMHSSRGRPVPPPSHPTTIEHHTPRTYNVPIVAEEDTQSQPATPEPGLTAAVVSDPSVEPPLVVDAVGEEAAIMYDDYISPERPATQRAPSLHSSRVREEGEEEGSRPPPPSHRSQSHQPRPPQQQLLSRANFNSEVLIDDGRLYLFENVEFNRYSR